MVEINQKWWSLFTISINIVWFWTFWIEFDQFSIYLERFDFQNWFNSIHLNNVKSDDGYGSKIWLKSDTITKIFEILAQVDSIAQAYLIPLFNFTLHFFTMSLSEFFPMFLNYSKLKYKFRLSIGDVIDPKPNFELYHDQIDF